LGLALVIGDNGGWRHHAAHRYHERHRLVDHRPVVSVAHPNHQGIIQWLAYDALLVIAVQDGNHRGRALTGEGKAV
jgi:hypothetical protein